MTDTVDVLDRSHLRAGIIGFTFAASIAVGLLLMFASSAKVGNDAADREANHWADVAYQKARHADSLQVRLDSATAELDAQRAQLEPVVAKVRQFSASVTVDTAPNTQGDLRPIDALNLAARQPADTVRMATIKRKDVDPVPFIVPRFIVDAWQDAAHLAIAQDTVINDYWRQLRESSTINSVLRSAHRADSLQVAALRRRRAPWCQVKCGIVLGVTGTLAAAWAADRAFSLLKPSDRHAFHIAASHPVF
jgi:hypothetical protein